MRTCSLFPSPQRTLHFFFFNGTHQECQSLPFTRETLWLLWTLRTHTCVSIFPSHYNFLGFVDGPLHYQLMALPFILSSTPQTFTKVLVLVLALLRSLDICNMGYLDVLFFMELFMRALVDNVKFKERCK